MDEAGFSLHPKLGLVWAKKGCKPKVPTASRHQRLNLAGWVAPWVGWHGLMRIDKGNTDSFLLFLKMPIDFAHKAAIVRLNVCRMEIVYIIKPVLPPRLLRMLKSQTIMFPNAGSGV
jgi:hypothetical protein